MSTTLASAAALLIYLVALLPVAVAGWKQQLFAPALAVIAGATLLVALLQTGIFANRISVPAARLEQTSSLASCAKIVVQLQQAGLITGGVGSERPVVRGENWSQLPSAVQEAVAMCLEQVAKKPVTVVVQQGTTLK